MPSPVLHGCRCTARLILPYARRLYRRPEELLTHELCEEVTVTMPTGRAPGEVASATVFRGPRLKVGRFTCKFMQSRALGRAVCSTH